MNLFPFFTRSEREIWSVSALLNSVIKNCTSTKLLQKASNMKALQKKKKKKKMSRYKITAKKKKKKKKICPGTKLLQKASNMKPLKKKKKKKIFFHILFQAR